MLFKGSPAVVVKTSKSSVDLTADVLDLERPLAVDVKTRPGAGEILRQLNKNVTMAFYQFRGPDHLVRVAKINNDEPDIIEPVAGDVAVAAADGGAFGAVGEQAGEFC